MDAIPRPPFPKKVTWNNIGEMPAKALSREYPGNTLLHEFGSFIQERLAWKSLEVHEGRLLPALLGTPHELVTSANGLVGKGPWSENSCIPANKACTLFRARVENVWALHKCFGFWRENLRLNSLRADSLVRIRKKYFGGGADFSACDDQKFSTSSPQVNLLAG